MGEKYLEIIKKLGKSRVKEKEPLAKYTTFKIGGPADLLVEVRKEEELIELIKLIKKLKIPWFILGGGSNVLVSDDGFRGVVIKIANSKYRISNRKVVAGAGLPLSKLVEEAVRHFLTGLEFAVGIPGTVGGAIRGNAGAWQQAIGDKIKRVKILTPEGEVKWLDKKDCGFDYRQSRFKNSGEIILEAELELEKGEVREIKQKISQNLEKRKNQPSQPSAGCIFVNPKPYSAGELIDKAGLKGKRIGDAQISVKHGNFIVNLGKAKAKDVVFLIKLIKETVKKKFGVELEEEICFLGFAKNQLID